MRYDPPSTPSPPRHRQCARNGCASVLLPPSSLCPQKEPLGIHLPFMEGQNGGRSPGTVAAAAGRSRVQEERLSNGGHLRPVSMAADHHRGDPILPPVAAVHLLLDVSHQNPGTTDLSLYLPREVLCPWPVIHVPPHGNHRGDSTQLLQHVFAAHVTRMQDALDPRERTSQIRGKIAMRVRYHPDFVDLLRNTGITTHTHPSGIATCAPPAAPGNCPADSWPFPGPAG